MNVFSTRWHFHHHGLNLLLNILHTHLSLPSLWETHFWRLILMEKVHLLDEVLMYLKRKAVGASFRQTAWLNVLSKAERFRKGWRSRDEWTEFTSCLKPSVTSLFLILTSKVLCPNWTKPRPVCPCIVLSGRQRVYCTSGEGWSAGNAKRCYARWIRHDGRVPKLLINN